MLAASVMFVIYMALGQLALVARAAPVEAASHAGYLHERQLPDGDPCGRLRGQSGAFSPRTIFACLETIPLYQSTKDNIMAVAEAMSSIDVFAANQLGDDDPSLHQGIDLQAEFKRIRATDYPSDYAFQRDLSLVMDSLNDGHYRWISCYDVFFDTTHALPIVAYASDPKSTESNVYIAPDVENFIHRKAYKDIYSRFGIDGKELAGARVLQMEGKPVWDYLEQDLVPHSCAFTDKQQRLNSLFASYTASNGGTFGRVPGLFTSTRDMTRNNISMVVQTVAGVEKAITLPWITMWDQAFSWTYASGQDLWDAICNAPFQNLDTSEDTGNFMKSPTAETFQATSRLPQKRDGTSDFDAFAAEKYAACPIASNNVLYPFPDSTNPTRSGNYLGGRDVQFYQLDDGKTGVVYMSTFYPQPLTDDCYWRYIVDLVVGLQNLMAIGIENILVDTSNNGGGAVALGQVAQRLFTGEDLLAVNNFASVFRKAPLTEAIHQHYLDNPGISPQGFFSPEMYHPANSTDDFGPKVNIFQPGESFKINGREFALSNRISDSIDEIKLIDGPFGLPDKAPFAPPNVVFTGNGICVSACATFINFLIEYYNATAYIHAAHPSDPIEFTASAAGQATSTAQIYAEVDTIGFKDDKLLPRLKHAGEFGFALRAVISPRIAPDTFMQYRSYPAQNRFALTKEMYESPIKMWDYVAGQVF